LCQTGVLEVNSWVIKERILPIKVAKGKPRLDWTSKTFDEKTEEATLLCTNPKCGDSTTYDSVDDLLSDLTALLHPKYMAVEKVNGQLVSYEDNDSAIKVQYSTKRSSSAKQSPSAKKQKKFIKVLLSKNDIVQLCNPKN
jgi:hypothetical protein